jgi:16S rRNA (uracil1498-N3)-methyltransferase
VSVAFALTKGAKPEWTVQKLTEVGVDFIIPVVAERSIVRWDEDKAAHQAARWREVARLAAMQSRRVRMPVVEDACSFAEVASRPGAALAEAGGGDVSLSHPLILVGPEGGWSEAELDRGLPRVDLGDTVLRAETAALAAGIRLCALRAG